MQKEKVFYANKSNINFEIWNSVNRFVPFDLYLVKTTNFLSILLTEFT